MKHPDSTVDVRGTDDHEISYVPLVNAGSVSLNTSDGVIIMMCQHAHNGKNKSIH